MGAEQAQMEQEMEEAAYYRTLSDLAQFIELYGFEQVIEDIHLLDLETLNALVNNR